MATTPDCSTRTDRRMKNAERGTENSTASHPFSFFIHHSSITVPSGSGGIRTRSMSRSKRDWSAKLPTEPRRRTEFIPFVAIKRNEFRSTIPDAQRGSRTHRRAGLSRAALPVGVAGRNSHYCRSPTAKPQAEAVGLEPTSGFKPPPVFKTGPSSSRMTSD